jgi:glyoxylate reductase
LNVLLTRRIPSSVFATLSAAHEVDLHDGQDPMSADELKQRVVGKDGLICLLSDRISDDVLAAGDRLRIVANIAVGYENIDVEAARRRGIVVTNTPDVLTEAVAEFTWGLILNAARRIGEGERLVRRGGWKGWGLDFMLGMELRGKQLGIIGHGRIGRAVAAKAPAFGMDVVFASRKASPERADDHASRKASPERADDHASRRASPERADDLASRRAGPERADNPARRRAGPERADGRHLSLDELLVTSDVISIHAPATRETRHLIGRRELMRMKRSALLVNTARGSIVDEEALAWALGERLIAGAALDVYEREPEIFAPLLSMEHVVLAPHLGSATRETRTAMADLAVRNVLAVLAGEPPLTPV